MTMRGMILGTAAYMSPEQAKGKPVDKRADIWAFGCVLYELLAGRRAFAGDDISTTLAAVLLKDPEWQALPPATPVALRRLLTRCLTKDPKVRRGTSARRAFASTNCSGAPETGSGHPLAPAKSGRRRVTPWAAAVALARGDAGRRHRRAAVNRQVTSSAGRCGSRLRRRRTRSLAVRSPAAPASRRKWPCHRTAGTSSSSPDRKPRFGSSCDRFRRLPPGRFRGPKVARSRSGRRTAGSSGSSRTAN